MDISYDNYSLLWFIDYLLCITPDQLAKVFGIKTEAAEERLCKLVDQGYLDVIKPNCDCSSRYYTSSEAKSLFLDRMESNVRESKALKDSPTRFSVGSDITGLDIELLVALETMGCVPIRRVAEHLEISLLAASKRVERLIYYGFLQRIVPKERFVASIYGLLDAEFHGGIYWNGKK